MSALDEHIDTPARTSGYRYSPYAWAVAAERSLERSRRRRARFRRYQVGLCLVCAWLAVGLALAVWWLI